MNKKLFSLILLLSFGNFLMGMGGRCFYGPDARAAVAQISGHGAAIAELTKRLNEKDTQITNLQRDLAETRNQLHSMMRLVGFQVPQPAAQSPAAANNNP